MQKPKAIPHAAYASLLRRKPIGMEKLIVDRIEGRFAVCELADKTITDIKLDILPGEVAEGDVLTFDGKDYTIDTDETNNRRKRIEKMMDDLFVD